MTNLLTPRRIPALLLWLGCCAGAQAQLLGSPMADVLLGRPLDMSLPARFATDGTGDNDCVRADVFYGERRLQDSAVRTSLTGPADQRRIRVEADAPVDEPIVTVSVRAGCRNTVTRNYTLLPEYPSERLLAAADARQAMAAAAPAVPLRLARAAAPSTSPRKASAPRPVVVARAATIEPPPPRPRSSSHRAPRTEAVARGPRLKLEPLDLPERDALLRVSSSLAEPNGDASRRATAALLWQAINADPEEVLRTSVMIQKLEQDLAQLRLASGQTRAEMAALRQRLDQAQPWYLSPLFVQLLALLVLASAGVAAFLWWRTRDLRVAPGTWYLPPEAAAEPVAEAPAPVVAPEPVAGKKAVAREPVLAPVVTPPTVQPVVAAIPPAAAAAVDFDLPAPRTPGDEVLRVETLAATFEEVDFLASLGLLSDAMDLLKNYLQDSAGPAPVAYLELMRLCEQAEDPAAVATVRRRYAQAFGVEAPRLPQVTAEGGLEGLPELAARITRAWNDGEAPQAIAQVLFSVPTPAAPLTLQAARDLLALHDLALVRAAEGAATGARDEAPLAPWAHDRDLDAALEAEPVAAEADGGRQFGLDVDLSATAAPAASVSAPPAPTLNLVPMLGEVEAERADAERRTQEAEDAFSAATASERVPVSRF